MVNNPTYIDEFGGGLTFNGSNQNILLSNSIALSSDSSFNLWVDLDEVDSVQYILGGTTKGFRYSSIDNTFLLFQGASGWSTVNWERTGGVVNIFVNRIGSDYEVYINGVYVGTGSVNSLDNIDIDLIGKRSDGYNFKGTIYDVKIYKRSLTSQEVTDLYNHTKDKYQ